MLRNSSRDEYGTSTSNVGRLFGYVRFLTDLFWKCVLLDTWNLLKMPMDQFPSARDVCGDPYNRELQPVVIKLDFRCDAEILA